MEAYGRAVPTLPNTQAPDASPVFLDLSPVNPHSSAQFTTCDRTGEKRFSWNSGFPTHSFGTLTSLHLGSLIQLLNITENALVKIANGLCVAKSLFTSLMSPYFIVLSTINALLHPQSSLPCYFFPEFISSWNLIYLIMTCFWFPHPCTLKREGSLSVLFTKITPGLK